MIATDAQVIAAAEALPFLVIKNAAGVPMVIRANNLHQTDTIVARVEDMATAQDLANAIPLPALALLEGPQRPTLVTRDGEVLAALGTEDEAWMWLQRHQGQSVDWAVRYEGYRVVVPARF
jgi:hypothetical protein